MKLIVASVLMTLLVISANAASLEKADKSDEVASKAAVEHAEHSHEHLAEPAAKVEEEKIAEKSADPVVPAEHKEAPAAELKALPEQNSEKVSMTILYEALCPDSRALIAELGKVYPDFKEHLQLKLIPFGRAKSLDSTGKEFECHHGPKECVANRIQSCGLEHLKSKQDDQENFVVCQMKKESEQTGRECAEHSGAIWSEVQSCVDGELGQKLQLAAEVATNAVRNPLKNVPTVLFNDKFDDGLQDRSVKGLKSTLCEVLADKKLKTCTEKA